MTMEYSLTRGPLSPSTLAAASLLTRQSVTPLSRAAFVRQPEMLCEVSKKTGLYFWLAQPP